MERSSEVKVPFTSAAMGQRDQGSDQRADQDADAVACHATHRGAERLAPARRDILLMQAWQRLAAAEHVQEAPNGPE
jgi:hypothetical protein